MDNTLLVSVLIPTYNRSDYLKEAIDSVLSQDFEQFEIVVVDNCSTDNTSVVMQFYNDTRIIYVKNGVNIGAVGNYNKALRLARGKYIYVFSDDDVMVSKGNLRAKVNILDRFSTVGLVYSNLRTIDSNGATIGGNWAEKNSKWREAKNNNALMPGRLAYNILYTDFNFVAMPSVMLRASIIQDNNIEFNNQLRYFVDWNMWMVIALFSDFYYIDEELLAIRVHASNESKHVSDHTVMFELLNIKTGLITLYGHMFPFIETNVNNIISKSTSISKDFSSGSWYQRILNFLRRKARGIL